MKKLLLIIAAVCLLSAGNAQTQFEQGKIITGVSSTLNLMSITDDWCLAPGSDFMSMGIGKYKYRSESQYYDYHYEYKIRGFNVLPRAGYFIMDNLAVGLDMILSSKTWVDPDDGEKWITSLLCAGPFARYYYPLEKFSPFAELNAVFGILSDKNKDGGDVDVERSSVVMLGGGLGAAFPLGEKVTFDVMAGYSFLSSKELNKEEANGESGTTKITSGMLGLRMGFTVLLNKP